jgi:hypothetical protein
VSGSGSNQITYLNANQFQLSVGAPSYSFGGPPTASPLKLGFKKGDQLLVSGTGPDNGKTFTFTDPDTLTVLETVSSTLDDYDFVALRRLTSGVLTRTGREWLPRLCAWSSVGDPDVSLTEERIRWIGVGSGGFPMIPDVLTLDSPTEYQSGLYLSDLSAGSSGTISNPTKSTLYVGKEYSGAEISLTVPVLVSEVGFFVDQNPTLSLNPADSDNPPALYSSFDGLMKSSDFNFLAYWTLKF